MSIPYNVSLADLWNGGEVLTTDTIKAILVMTDTTVDSEADAAVIADFGTLDEMDGAGYTRLTLTTPTVTRVTGGGNRAKFSSDNLLWAALGAGARDVKGMLLYKHVTDDTDSIPLVYLDSGGFPFTADGSDKEFAPHADGWFYVH